MPATAEPPPIVAKTPAAPKPAPAINPAPKPKADAPAPPPVVPSTPASDPALESNPFFEMESKHSIGVDRAIAKPDEEKPTETEPEPETKKPDEPEQKPVTPSKDDKTLKPKTEGGKLREELEKSRNEVADYKRRLSEFEAKAKDAKPAEEITSLTKRIADVEKERDEARAEIAMLNEGETPEFKSKHQEPFNREYKRAVALVKQLPVADANGQARTGTADDLAVVYSLPFAAADAKAKELFGDYAQHVMHHYRQLHTLDEEYREARDANKAQWQETKAKRQAEATQQREAWAAGLAKAREGLINKYAERFKDDGSDPEITKAMNESTRLWDKQPESFQEAVTKSAAVELAYKAHNRLVYQLNKQKQEIEALTAKLNEFQGSEPSTAKRKTEQASTGSREGTSIEDLKAEARRALTAR